MVEKMLAARGICVSYETVRQWAIKFGETFSGQIRQRAPSRGDESHLDEVTISIAGQPTCFGARSTRMASFLTSSSSVEETATLRAGL
jgi:hypothetical protein